MIAVIEFGSGDFEPRPLKNSYIVMIRAGDLANWRGKRYRSASAIIQSIRVAISIVRSGTMQTYRLACARLGLQFGGMGSFPITTMPLGQEVFLATRCRISKNV